MTSPRDALRALEQIKSILAPAVPKCCQGWQAEITYALQMIDELAAILQQMDSEPTVAQLQRTIDELARTGLRLVEENEALRRPPAPMSKPRDH